MTDDFATFFRRALTSSEGDIQRDAHPFQQRLAAHGLPTVLELPPGAGKTSVVLAWLWRRLHHPDEAVRLGTPRRLVFALPLRGLAEQVAKVVTTWLERLGLADDVSLHVVMGGAGGTQWQWRREAHKLAVIVGTIDSLVSKGLVRGYGISRSAYPVDFALVTNGAHWVLDEVQLCGPAATTLRQIEAFTRDWGVAEPVAVTYMTATVPWSLLDTVDNPRPLAEAIQGLTDDDRVGELGKRLGARRTIGGLDVPPGDVRALAGQVADLHRSGTRTLVILNTVRSARALVSALDRLRLDAEVVLLHSRFRAIERERHLDQLMADVAPDGPGRVVVATQVVEAGIDVDSATLITEAAPWSSLVQRAGRCNRYGQYDDAWLWWVVPTVAAPYPDEDIRASIDALTALEGRPVTTEELAARKVVQTDPAVTVLRRRDLLALFDTAPDLSGNDVDVAPYIRDNEDLDVAVAWARWDGADPPAMMTVPEPKWRCPVPIGEARAFAKANLLWRLDVTSSRWRPLRADSPPRSGEVLLADAASGGYDETVGWDPSNRAAVSPAAGDDLTELERSAEPAVAGEEPFWAETATLNQQAWVPLDEHLLDAERHARDLLAALKPDLPTTVLEAVSVAARLHDVGKAHPVWQDALCHLASKDQAVEIDSGRPWAKSDSDRPLRFVGREGFRHEFASLLLLRGPAAELLTDVAEPELVRYLVAAHHGRIRLQVRDPQTPGDNRLLGVEHGDPIEVPPILGVAIRSGVADLEPFSLGGEESWTRMVLTLRDRLGPFRLAYLEALVRIADWRASAAQETAR